MGAVKWLQHLSLCDISRRDEHEHERERQRARSALMKGQKIEGEGGGPPYMTSAQKGGRGVKK